MPARLGTLWWSKTYSVTRNIFIYITTLLRSKQYSWKCFSLAVNQSDQYTLPSMKKSLAIFFQPQRFLIRWIFHCYRSWPLWKKWRLSSNSKWIIYEHMRTSSCMTLEYLDINLKICVMKSDFQLKYMWYDVYLSDERYEIWCAIFVIWCLSIKDTEMKFKLNQRQVVWGLCIIWMMLFKKALEYHQISFVLLKKC